MSDTSRPCGLPWSNPARFLGNHWHCCFQAVPPLQPQDSQPSAGEGITVSTPLEALQVRLWGASPQTFCFWLSLWPETSSLPKKAGVSFSSEPHRGGTGKTVYEPYQMIRDKPWWVYHRMNWRVKYPGGRQQPQKRHHGRRVRRG